MNNPAPFHNKFKAFVLGCDPTAFTKEESLKSEGERKPIPFNVVFGLDKGLKYFAGINANLKAIGLNYKTDIYVQNLVTDYQKMETSQNKEWDTIAHAYIKPRKKEFDDIDPSHTIPVLLTSEHLYYILLNDDEVRKSPVEIYSATEVVIPPEKNKLGRPLLVLYRHHVYSLKNKLEYREQLNKFFTF